MVLLPRNTGAKRNKYGISRKFRVGTILGEALMKVLIFQHAIDTRELLFFKFSVPLLCLLLVSLNYTYEHLS